MRSVASHVCDCKTREIPHKTHISRVVELTVCPLQSYQRRACRNPATRKLTQIGKVMQSRKLIVLVVVCAAAIAAAVTPRSSITSRHRASLSDDLRAFEASHSTTPVRVIAHGGHDLAAIAARNGVHVVRTLDAAAVVEANAAQITALSAEPGIEHLSGDLPVGHFMTVSTKATLADQTRAGKSGGLLGLGGIPGLTGQGIVVAVLDSGIAAHKALSGKVIANVSMIAGETPNDEYGHGTH